MKRDDINLPESNIHYGGMAVCLKSKTGKVVVGESRTKPPSRRTCFSLINIGSTNDCKVLYNNCILCNRRKNIQLASPRKIHSRKTEKFWKERQSSETQFSLIGFATSQLTIHKVEKAAVEHIREESFTIGESSKSVENRGDTKFASNIPYKITSVTFGLILSLYIFHLLYQKFLSFFVIK